MGNNNYIVYAHINKINGKMYIGLTKQRPEERWRKGKGYKSSPHFYSSIMKYGWNNFVHLILFDKLTKDEAKNLEIMLISKYKTRNKLYGYNLTKGGDDGNGSPIPFEVKEKIKQTLSKKVVQLSKKDNSLINTYDSLINTYDSLIDAEKQTGISSKHISRCCLKQRKSTKGYHWMFYEDYLNNGFNIGDTQTKKVICVEKNKIFNSIKEASDFIGVSPASVCNCCKGKTKTSGGYTWNYIA